MGFPQQRPDAELAQPFGAVLGQCDFPAVEGGVLQRLAGLLFDEAGAQAAAAQRACQAQAGGARADDDEVEVHGGAAYRLAARCGLTQVK
ncbi:hypothetical protein FQZ97_948330 [compost metagenome]